MKVVWLHHYRRVGGVQGKVPQNSHFHPTGIAAVCTESTAAAIKWIKQRTRTEPIEFNLHHIMLSWHPQTIHVKIHTHQQCRLMPFQLTNHTHQQISLTHIQCANMAYSEAMLKSGQAVGILLRWFVSWITPCSAGLFLGLHLAPLVCFWVYIFLWWLVCGFISWSAGFFCWFKSSCYVGFFVDLHHAPLVCLLVYIFLWWLVCGFRSFSVCLFVGLHIVLLVYLLVYIMLC